jgi:hypothetical protein
MYRLRTQNTVIKVKPLPSAAEALVSATLASIFWYWLVPVLPRN